jgi:hypothetical protein
VHQNRFSVSREINFLKFHVLNFSKLSKLRLLTPKSIFFPAFYKIFVPWIYYGVLEAQIPFLGSKGLFLPYLQMPVFSNLCVLGAQKLF